MKIDVTQIEGYENMSPEEKLKACLLYTSSKGETKNEKR